MKMGKILSPLSLLLISSMVLMAALLAVPVWAKEDSTENKQESKTESAQTDKSSAAGWNAVPTERAASAPRNLAHRGRAAKNDKSQIKQQAPHARALQPKAEAARGRWQTPFGSWRDGGARRASELNAPVFASSRRHGNRADLGRSIEGNYISPEERAGRFRNADARRARRWDAAVRKSDEPPRESDVADWPVASRRDGVRHSHRDDYFDDSRASDYRPEKERQEKRLSWVQKKREQVRQENLEAERNAVHYVPDLKYIKTPFGENVKPEYFDRKHHKHHRQHYASLHHRYGFPGFGIVYIPRPVNAFSVGYRVGFRDGLRVGLHYGVSNYYHRHRHPVYTHFYYPYYFEDPYYAKFHYPGYYPSIYGYYGWVPRWCSPRTVIILSSDPYIGYYSPRPRYYLEYYRLDTAGLEQALSEIRRGWLASDIDYLAYHLREDDRINIYFESDYAYSVSADEYYSMTLDAMSTIVTEDLSFTRRTWLDADTVFVSGRHRFIDPDNNKQTVFISLWLQRAYGEWFITGAGSSPNPINSPYRDFRF